jgi:hypothetical protein
MVKIGSRWSDGNGRFFHVINTVEIDGKNWVFYKLENAKKEEVSEFSCYEESFLARFLPYVNQ